MTTPAKAPLSRTVSRAFSGLAARGFTPAPAAAAPGFVSLVKRAAEDVCLLVFVKDQPAGESVSLWVAPPDFPDEGLDRMRVGYRILLAERFSSEPLEDLLAVAEARAIRLLDGVPALYPLLRTELPITTSPRAVAHRKERAIAAWFRAWVKGSGARFQPILAAVEQAAAKGKTLAAAEKATRELVGALLDEAEARAGFEAWMSGPPGPEVMIPLRLPRVLYLDALAPFVENKT